MQKNIQITMASSLLIISSLSGCASKFKPIFRSLAYVGGVKDDAKVNDPPARAGIEPTAPCSLINSPLEYSGQGDKATFTPCQQAIIEVSADFCEKKISDGDLVNRIMGWIYVGGGAIGIGAGAYNQASNIGKSTTASTLSDAAAISAIGNSAISNSKPMSTKGQVKYSDLVDAATAYIKNNDWRLNISTEIPKNSARFSDKYGTFLLLFSKLDGLEGPDDESRKILAEDIIITDYYVGLFNSVAGACATSFSSPFVAHGFSAREKSLIHNALFIGGYTPHYASPTKDLSKPKSTTITVTASDPIVLSSSSDSSSSNKAN